MPNTVEILSPSNLAELERALHAERARLERFLPPVPSVDTDPATGMEHGEIPMSDGGDEPFAPTPRQADARLNAVLDALTRIREGRYGTCIRCGAGIPFGRLIVLPESDHCVGCGPA